MHALRSPGEVHTGASRPWRLPAAVGAALVSGTAAVVALDPSDTGAPLCVSQTAFGIDCPLCGGLRCVNSLARGDVLGAADHNVVLAVVLPVVALAWALWLSVALTGRRLRVPTVPRSAWFALGALLVAFAVARNLGGDGWIGWLASTGSS